MIGPVAVGARNHRAEGIIDRAGMMRFGFYKFLSMFGREPEGPDDLFDGLAVAAAMAEIEALAWQKT